MPEQLLSNMEKYFRASAMIRWFKRKEMKNLRIEILKDLRKLSSPVQTNIDNDFKVTPTSAELAKDFSQRVYNGVTLPKPW